MFNIIEHEQNNSYFIWNDAFEEASLETMCAIVKWELEWRENTYTFSKLFWKGDPFCKFMVHILGTEQEMMAGTTRRRTLREVL